MDIGNFIKHEPEDDLQNLNNNYDPHFKIHIVKEEFEEYTPNFEVEATEWPRKNVLKLREDKFEVTLDTEDDLKTPSIQRCCLCDNRFVNRYSLLQHNLIHLQVTLITKAMYQCDLCLFYFKNKAVLSEHIYIKHASIYSQINPELPKTKSLHKCHICKKVFNYKGWHDHLNNVHGKRHKCGDCEKTFKSERYLKRHMLYVHEGLKPLWRFRPHDDSDRASCLKCRKVLGSQQTLAYHMKNVHSERFYECRLCNSKLKSKSYLLTHIARVHYDDGKDYVCDLCTKKFRSPRYLSVHMRNSHSNGGAMVDFNCVQCRLNFKSKRCLDRHRKHIHLNGKWIVCRLCDKQFSSYYGLTIHKRRIHASSEVFERVDIEGNLQSDCDSNELHVE